MYRSPDAQRWARQAERLLATHVVGADDGVIGHHTDVVLTGPRAYLIYFTHPGRGPTAAKSRSVEWRRSSLQIAERRLEAEGLRCDRDAATYVALKAAAEPVGYKPAS